MHPPFHVGDLRVVRHDSAPRPARSIPKRGGPERLDLSPGAGLSRLPDHLRHDLPEPETTDRAPVRPVRRRLRSRLGLWLIRLGERLAEPPCTA